MPEVTVVHSGQEDLAEELAEFINDEVDGVEATVRDLSGEVQLLRVRGELTGKLLLLFIVCDRTVELLNLFSTQKVPIAFVLDEFNATNLENVIRSNYPYIFGIYDKTEIEDDPELLEALLMRELKRNKCLAKEKEGRTTIGSLTSIPGGDGSFVSLFIGPMRQLMLNLRRVVTQLDLQALGGERPYTTSHDTKWSVERQQEFRSGNNLEEPRHIIDQLEMKAGELLNAGNNPRRMDSILVLGPSGSGKTLIARWIESIVRERVEWNQPRLFEISAANMEREKINYELFGALVGSFTDAATNPGAVLSACKGVLLLNEVDTLDKEMQGRMLRYLESGFVTPRGWWLDPIWSPCLLIATSNKTESEIRSGFREDFLFRFKHILTLPSLKERETELEILVDCVLQNSAINPERNGVRLVKYISGAALTALRKLLTTMPFAGNFRELEDVLSQAVFMARMDRVDTILSMHIDICTWT